MADNLFDLDLLQVRRKRAVAGYSRHDFLHQQSDDIIIERLEDVRNGEFEKLKLTGVSNEISQKLNGRFGIKSRVEDSANLVVSSFDMHLVNNVPQLLLSLHAALAEEGLFLAGMLGGETLTELRHVLAEAESELYGGVSPRVIPFIDVKDAGMLLQKAGFAMPMADVERFTVTYETIIALAHDLRGMGLANVMLQRSRHPLSRRFWLRAGEIYQQKFPAEDGRIRASFDILTLQGWKNSRS